MSEFSEDKYFPKSVQRLLCQNDITFDDTDMAFYKRTLGGGDESFYLGDVFVEGDFVKNAQTLNMELSRYLENYTVDEMCEPLIETWFRNKDYFRGCDIHSVADIVEDCDQWLKELKEFNDDLERIIPILDQDYSLEKEFVLVNTDCLDVFSDIDFSFNEFKNRISLLSDIEDNIFDLEVEESVSDWRGSKSQSFFGKDKSLYDCLRTVPSADKVVYFIDENLDLCSSQTGHDGGHYFTYKQIDDNGEVKPLGQKAIDSLCLPDDILERWEQFKSNKVARVEKLEMFEPKVETPAEVARKAKERANKQNTNSNKSINKSKSIKR